MTTVSDHTNCLEQHLGAVAHDLRGPLSVVSGHAQVLKRMCETKAPYEKMRPGIEAILRSAMKLSAIVDELAQSGQDATQDRQPEQVAVEDLLGHALRGERGKLVKLEMAPDLPPVSVVRQAAELRIATLFGAIVAGRDGEPVTVRVGRHGEAVRIVLENVWLDLPVA